MAKKKTQQPKSPALRYIFDRYVAGKPKRLAAVERERLNLDIACKIYELRTAANLSQRELAKRVKTSASNICRLEDADYQGHSLSMLRRIAEALGQRIEIQFVPLGRKAAQA